MYAACKDCALTLAMSEVKCKVCNEAPDGVVMASFDDGVFFPTEELIVND